MEETRMGSLGMLLSKYTVFMSGLAIGLWVSVFIRNAF